MSASSILAGVMEDIGGPYSADTLDALLLWAQSEGTPDSWNNPLATTLDCCGGTDVNSDGVKAYPTVNDGTSATYRTLQGSAYSAVVSAIRNNASWSDIWSAINASPWCSGCQSGLYPVALYDAIKAGGHIPQPSPGGGGGGNSPPAEAPAGVDAGVIAAWENLHEQTGPYVNSLLQSANTLTHSDPSR